MNYFFLYVGVFFISAILGNFYQKYRLKRNRINSFINFFWLVIIIIIPLLLSALRYDIGEDYGNYEAMFELAQSNNTLFHYYFPDIEIGNQFLMKLGFWIFGSVTGVFALYSILTLVILMLAVLYYQDRIPLFSAIMITYVLYYPATYNTVRQALAIAIVLFSFRFIEQKKFLHFIVCIIFAMLFHSTAFIAIPFYFYYNAETKFNQILEKIIFAGYIFLPVIAILLYTQGNNIPIIGRYFQNYEMAFNMDYWIDILWRLILYIPFIFCFRRDIKRDNRNKLYYFLLIVDLEFLVLSLFFEWAYRFTYYAAFAQVVIIGQRLEASPNKETKLAKTVYYIGIYLILFAFLYCLWQRDGIVPYRSIFSS